MTTDNRISLQKLEIFKLVAELGGVRRAAEALYVSEPVVSAHLKSLQDRLGAKLFERDGRGIALTEVGGEVLAWANEVLRGREELDRDIQSMSKGLAGVVSIGASITVGNMLVTPPVIEFRKENPGAVIRLVTGSVEAALEATRLGHHDFAVVATSAVLNWRIFTAQLIRRPRWTLVAAASNDTLPRSVNAIQLSRLPFICAPSGTAIRQSQDTALAAVGVQNRRVEIELGSPESIKQAIVADLGVALLWRPAVAAELDAGVFREIEILGRPLRDHLYAVHRNGKRFSPIQRRLFDMIMSSISNTFTDPAETPEADLA